jgi:hypothetical protein
MTYERYLALTGKWYSKVSWIEWSVECRGLTYLGALTSANDPDAGYEG